jgi:ureidoglycolate hydrolase
MEEKMEIKKITDDAFVRYGRILEGYDVSELLEKIGETEKPADRVIYEPSEKKLESLQVARDFAENAYGGMKIQIGFCNGNNTKLNCLEYHRGSEVNVPADDMVLLLAPLQSVKNGKIDTSLVEAFFVPKGTAVLIYETTLHYAPCNSPENKSGFRVAVILPKETNTQKPALTEKNAEDKLLRAKNKWLIAHADSDEAKNGAFVGLTGKNIDIAE